MEEVAVKKENVAATGATTYGTLTQQAGGGLEEGNISTRVYKYTRVCKYTYKYKCPQSCFWI